MANEYELTLHGLSTFLREVLEPAVYPLSAPLEARIFQIRDPLAALPTAEEAARADFVPIALHDAWGPKWSTAWFLVTGEVPEAMRDGQGQVMVRFSSGTEAQVWAKSDASSDGGWLPVRGLDVNRDEIPLTGGGEKSVRLIIEAACNHPFGVVGFEWDTADTHARWNGPTPGRLERCEITVRDPRAYEVKIMFAFALGLLKELPATGARAGSLLHALRRAHTILVARPCPARSDGLRTPTLMLEGAALERAESVLRESLAMEPGGSVSRCYAVGHAHIDTAWLWPLRETRRKCLRSFSNQLRLMEEFPQYIFMCSQAQQYAWVKETSPGLYAQIKQAVSTGAWEPQGGMWVEPDCNCPSGESLVRQVLHGVNFWEREFPDARPQSVLYLPDTFGFPATLPQIMAQCGLKTFVTNKLHWNKSNMFPHTSFIWEGLDGTRVLAHNTPGQDYNAVNTPKELVRGETTHKNKDLTSPALWLQPFGYGDGGGGATELSIRYAQLAGAGGDLDEGMGCEGLPLVRFRSCAEFCDDLAEALASPDALPTPVWAGELYLEVHRGTLTSQGWIKKANRRAEEDLRFAEVLLCAGPDVRAGEPAFAAAVSKLERAWELTLLNQFHDILPGSSIGWVYEDAKKDYVRIEKITDGLIAKGTTAWLADLATVGVAKPVAVFNPGSVARSGVVELEDERLIYVRDIPALGVKIVDAAERALIVPCSIEEDTEEGLLTLTNGLVTVVINADGEIVSLCSGSPEVPGEEVVADGGVLNRLAAYEDVPHMWDAWDIDITYENKLQQGRLIVSEISIVCEESLRVAVKVKYTLGESAIEQVYSLDAGSRRVDIHTRVEWRERRTMLRALMHTGVRAAVASYEVQFGVVERPTHRTTSWDAAKFEVCAHRWMDLSERGLGLALLNDCKYGHSCHGGMMGLTLLRGTMHPDASADIGTHEFSYALLPHGGDWRAALVDREGEALNMPFVTFELNTGEPGAGGREFTPLQLMCEGDADVAIAAIKPASDGRGVIVRLYECRGGTGTVRLAWHRAAEMTLVDLLERPLDEHPAADEHGEVLVEEADGFEAFDDQPGMLIQLAPWRIVSVRVEEDTM
jgi:alpha-mannosidase